MVATLGTPKTLTPSKAAPKSAGWHALTATFIGEGFDAMDASIYFIAMFPALSELLHTKDATTVGWHGSIILAIFMLGWSLGSIASGWAADRFGRVKTMIWTIILYAVATALCATAQSWWDFGIYRFFVGLGIGGEIAVGGVVLAEAWTGPRRRWALAVMQTSFGAGCLLCSLCNLSTGSLGWRWLFLMGLAPAFTTLYMRLKLSESTSFKELHAKRLELTTKVKAALTSAEMDTLKNPLLVAFNEQNRVNTIVCTVGAGAAIIGYWACLSWMSPWINQLTGTEAVNERSAASFYMGIGGILGTLFTPLLIKWLGFRRSMQLGFIASFLPTILMYLTVKSYTPALNIWALVIGFGAYSPFLVVTIYSLEIFATNVLGSVSGIMWSGGRILAAIAGLFTGPIILFFHGSYAFAAATISLVYITGIVAAHFVKEPAKAFVESNDS